MSVIEGFDFCFLQRGRKQKLGLQGMTVSCSAKAVV